MLDYTPIASTFCRIRDLTKAFDNLFPISVAPMF